MTLILLKKQDFAPKFISNHKKININLVIQNIRKLTATLKQKKEPYF